MSRTFECYGCAGKGWYHKVFAVHIWDQMKQCEVCKGTGLWVSRQAAGLAVPFPEGAAVCPKHGEPLESGYGLMGGGLGSYEFCPIEGCGHFTKWQDPEMVDRRGPDPNSPLEQFIKQICSDDEDNTDY